MLEDLPGCDAVYGPVGISQALGDKPAPVALCPPQTPYGHVIEPWPLMLIAGSSAWIRRRVVY